MPKSRELYFKFTVYYQRSLFSQIPFHTVYFQNVPQFPNSSPHCCFMYIVNLVIICSVRFKRKLTKFYGQRPIQPHNSTSQTTINQHFIVYSFFFPFLLLKSTGFFYLTNKWSSKINVQKPI